jgi:hypothetical protein
VGKCLQLRSPNLLGELSEGLRGTWLQAPDWQIDMPICERDPWRFQFFEGVACPENVRVPTDDLDCFEWFPQHNWVYEKLQIARSQGLACGTPEDVPASFPVFAKPNINLRGMGWASGPVNARSELRALPHDHMWMPVAHGDHISTDCAIENGEVRWLRYALGHPWEDGMFRYWMIESAQRDELTPFLTDWVRKHMSGYTGMMNFETIGSVMIEAHLRFADQWCDLYGRPWFDALVGLYANGTWREAQNPKRVGYSIPLFAKHGQVPPHPSAELQARIRAMPDVSSLQITYFPAKAGDAHPMPPGGFRLGLINCWDLDAGFAALDVLSSGFPGVEVMRQ